jgi:hypothetical protein
MGELIALLTPSLSGEGSSRLTRDGIACAHWSALTVTFPGAFGAFPRSLSLWRFWPRVEGDQSLRRA